MALKGMLYRENVFLVDGLAEFGLVPLGICIINSYKSWDFCSGRMCEGILGIATKEEVIEGMQEA